MTGDLAASAAHGGQPLRWRRRAGRVAMALAAGALLLGAWCGWTATDAQVALEGLWVLCGA